MKEIRRFLLDYVPLNRVLSAFDKLTLRKTESNEPFYMDVGAFLNEISGVNFNFNRTISEQATGIVDGTNRIFTSSEKITITGVSVYVNGLQETDFAITGDKEITLGFAPLAVGFTDKVTIIYTQTIEN